MARADLLKKLFSSFKNDDRELFYKIASEIIEDERKKNHENEKVSCFASDPVCHLMRT